MSEATTWQELLDRLADSDPARLDVRSAAAYARGHLPGSANRPVPVGANDDVLASALPSHVLPPRHAPLAVLADDPSHADRIAAWLRDRGRIAIEVLPFAPDWDAAPDGTLVAGNESALLWEAAPWLVENAGLLPPTDHGPVVDFGSGSGRSAVWLAARGYDVTAVDRHPEALGWARDLAADLDVTVGTLQADLTDAGQWPRGPWSAVLMLRFLHRPLVAALSGLVAPGGVVVLRTFRWEEGAWTLPRRVFCLEPGELPTLFPDDRWELLATAEDHDDDGRPAAGVVARRR